MGQTEIDILIREKFDGPMLVSMNLPLLNDYLQDWGFEETKAEALIDAFKKRKTEEE